MCAWRINVAFPQAEPSAKAFLVALIPTILTSINVSPKQSFYGIPINIESEARKRICEMEEAKAKIALKTLKEALEKWESNLSTT